MRVTIFFFSNYLSFVKSPFFFEQIPRWLGQFYFSVKQKQNQFCAVKSQSHSIENGALPYHRTEVRFGDQKDRAGLCLWDTIRSHISRLLQFHDTWGREEGEEKRTSLLRLIVYL